MDMPLAFMNLGLPELIVIGIIGILLFGRRLPEIGKSLGKTIVEFKKGLNSTGDELKQAMNEGDAQKNPYALNEGNKTQQPRQVKQIASSTDEP